MIGIFPAELLGETVEKVKRKPRKHTAHKLHVISWCPDCKAALLMGCEWKNSRGTGFCTFTEKISKRHICLVEPEF